MAALMGPELQMEEDGLFSSPAKLFKQNTPDDKSTLCFVNCTTEDQPNLNDILQQSLDVNILTTSDTPNSALETFNKLCMTISGNFPRALDFSNPAKSWWRYYEKQPATNTAMCYTCGVVFNRGPKQSTTSLSHHLKMYHQEHYISIQQAKDEEFKQNPKSSNIHSHVELMNQREEPNITSSTKKTNFNNNLINAVKLFPELYDPKQRSSGESEDRNKIWEVVAKTVGVDVSPELAKKRWLQIRDRYRKELKFAIRDNFAYTPKWPYFNQLTWLDAFLKDSCSTPMPRKNMSHNRVKISNDLISNSENKESQPIFKDEQNDNTNSFLTNLFASCNASTETLEVRYSPDSDSAIASTSDSHDFIKEHKENSYENSSDNSADNMRSSCFNQNSNVLEYLENFFQFGGLSSLASQTFKASRSKQTNPFEWINDEDMLFGRIVGLRLKNLTNQNKRSIRIAIEKLFEEYENKQDNKHL